ncbi:MAG: YncE family protein [Bacteroidetes bacterium]|nr:YncE family protein [Bacteroidota bacterium]
MMNSDTTMRLLSVFFFSVTLFALSAGPSPAQDTTEERNLLYVANQGEASVAIIDMASQEVIETVDLTALGFSANASPHHVIAEPDGSAWYVSLISENTVLKFNAENELVDRASMEAPGLLSLHPTEPTLFIAHSMMAVNPPQRIGMAPRDDLGALEQVDVFFDRPHAITVTPDGRFVYVGSLATNQLIGVDAESLRGDLLALDGPAHVLVQLAVSPDGQQVAGTGQLTGRLLLFDVGTEGQLTLTDQIAVGAQPWHPTYSPDGSRIYVPNKQANTVSVVDTEQRTVTHTIEHDAFAEPHGTALSPDGRYLYVSNNHQRSKMEHMMQDMAATGGGDDMHGNHDGDRKDHGDNENHGDHDSHEGHSESSGQRPGTIAVIDTETLEVVRVIEVGVYPTGIGTRQWR